MAQPGCPLPPGKSFVPAPRLAGRSRERRLASIQAPVPVAKLAGPEPAAAKEFAALRVGPQALRPAPLAAPDSFAGPILQCSMRT